MLEGKGWEKFGPKNKGQRSAGKKINCGRMLVNVGRWKTQPILWTERPTSAITEVGSLWPKERKKGKVAEATQRRGSHQEKKREAKF
jgi:hypothetical protein